MKTKEHQLDLRWLEAYRSQDPHFGWAHGSSLGFERNLHLDCRVIHVAGTNGKGSTIATLSQLLRQAGLRVGVFTSPYLIHYNDQITINGEAISIETCKPTWIVTSSSWKLNNQGPSFKGWRNLKWWRRSPMIILLMRSWNMWLWKSVWGDD